MVRIPVDPHDGAGLSNQAAAVRLTDLRHAQYRAECVVFVAAADWADRNHPDSGRSDKLSPLLERSVLLGGAGTPEVLEHAAKEFAARTLQSPQGGAR